MGIGIMLCRINNSSSRAGRFFGPRRVGRFPPAARRPLSPQNQPPAEIHGEPISPAKNSTTLAAAAPVIAVSPGCSRTNFTAAA